MARTKAQFPIIADFSYGFGTWWDLLPGVSDHPHTHPDMELNYFSGGPVRYFLTGRYQTLPACRMIMFWAGLPHHLVEVPSDRQPCWTAHIPIARFMQWQLNETFTQYLLDGHVMLGPTGEPAETAFEQIRQQRWAAEFGENNPEARNILMLEIEALVRRLARTSLIAPQGHHRVVSAGGARQIERVCRYIAEHYTEPLSVGTIARAMQLHPKYLMQLFKKHCGVSIWEYLLRMRTSHAQQLLINTDLKVIDVALESGFGSMCRFHALFARHNGCTPRQYRLKMQEETE